MKMPAPDEAVLARRTQIVRDLRLLPATSPLPSELVGIDAATPIISELERSIACGG